MFIFNTLISAICEAARNPVYPEAEATPERDYSRLLAEGKCRSFRLEDVTRSSCG